MVVFLFTSVCFCSVIQLMETTLLNLVNFARYNCLSFVECIISNGHLLKSIFSLKSFKSFLVGRSPLCSYAHKASARECHWFFVCCQSVTNQSSFPHVLLLSFSSFFIVCLQVSWDMSTNVHSNKNGKNLSNLSHPLSWFPCDKFD